VINMGKTLQELAGGLKTENLPTAGETLDDLPQFGTFQPPPPPGAYRFKLPMDLGAVWDTFDVPDKQPPQRVKATRLTNNERKRGKGGAVVASDFDYLLRACGEKTKPKGNKEYIAAVQKQAGKEFGGDIRYSWKCSKDREIRVRDGAGQLQLVEGRNGCGEQFYQEDVPKTAQNEVPYEIVCSCGALLRAFANLDNIRS
jgi:hypothetical protein